MSVRCVKVTFRICDAVQSGRSLVSAELAASVLRENIEAAG
jgi:hypothetical protein